MEVQKIKIKNDYKLPNIIQDIKNGSLRIPQFQRKFVWEKSKVIKLLDSIYKEFPIGSFFFWTAPRKYYFFYRDIVELKLPKPDKYERMSFIIDGQQRLTSLYATVKGLTLYDRDYSHICFDLDKKEFIDKKPDNQRFISVSDLFSEENFEIYDNLTAERKKSFNQCVKRFYNYPFSAIDVRDKELDEVCDIFERINQGGRRLNLFDLISASTWSPEFDLRDAVDKENDFLSRGFGKIDNEVFTQTLALISKGSCTRSSQLQLRKEDINKYWIETIESTRLAIDYMKNNFGVVNYLFIPYRGMISLVAYLFYKNKRKSLSNKQADFLSTWFWQATFSERYAASTLTIMTEDRKLFDKILENKEVKINFPVSLNIDSLIRIRMYRKSAIKNGILCLLATKNPRHFKNNSLLSIGEEYYSDFNNSEKHHIFPKSIIKKKFGLAIIHSLPNFCFIPAELNKEISNKKPSKYFENYQKTNSSFKETLKTHLISYDESIKRDDYISFLGSRAATLIEEIGRMTGDKVSKMLGENENIAIDRVEKLIRDLIFGKIKLENKKDWQEKIPSDVFAQIKKRAFDHIKQNPSKSFSDFTARELLDFSDLMDYPKIILKNWEAFQSEFRSMSNVEKRFISLKEYRNAIKHNREMTSFLKKEGEAAVEWLSSILEKSVNKESVNCSTKDHLEKVQPRIRKIFLDIKKEIKDLGEIREQSRKRNIGYWSNGTKFLDVIINKEFIVLRVRVKGYKLYDPKKLTQELGTKSKYWKSLYREINLSSSEKIKNVVDIIKQAYESTK